MRKFIFLFSLISTTLLCAQVGVGEINPTALLDVKSSSSAASTKAVEINNSMDETVLEVRNNGNFIFSGAIMPEGNSGQVNDVLVSNGENQSPAWTKIEGPEGTELITQVFNARRNSLSTTRNDANNEIRVNFPQINISASPTIGNWNPISNEFTVSKFGLYHITSGLRAYNVLPDSKGIFKINTSTYVQPFNGQITQSSSGESIIINLNFTGEIIVALYPGEKIWVSSKIDSDWNQSNSYVHIKFSEL